LKGLLEYVGLEVVVPPPSSKRTMSLGVQHGPEFACLPLKLNIGNLIEAKELGADTFIMAGGVGPCRFGLYGHLEKDILADIGIPYKSLILEPPDRGIWQFLQRVKKLVGRVSWLRVIQGVKLAYEKALYVDELEKLVQYLRPREYRKGTADKVLSYSLTTLDKAQNRSDLQEAFGLARQKLLHIPHDEKKKVLKIGLVGEIFTLLEPFASLEIEKTLGYLGAEVTRSIYLSDWINEHLFKGWLKGKGGKDYKQYAPPYLNHFVGGHGQESIGAGIAFAREGYHGIVQVAPLTCMPEIVAHTIFPRVAQDTGLPVMTVYVDEQTGQAGINTRLEAFLDLLLQKNNYLSIFYENVT